MADVRTNKRHSFFKDLSGQTFGKLTVATYAGKKRNAHCWNCVCECGGTWSGPAHKIRSGHVRSCGCAQAICILKYPCRKKYPLEFQSLAAAIKRCTVPTDAAYPRYGGRGITVCDRWMHGDGVRSGLECFVEDMGRRPPNLTLDRVTNDGHYEPGNCRWATDKEQSNNRRSNVLITFRGVTKNATQWAEEMDIHRVTIVRRHNAGWPPDLLFSKPNPGRKVIRKTRVP